MHDIMLIDDRADDLELARRHLSRRYNVQTATSLSSGMMQLNRTVQAAVVMDLHLANGGDPFSGVRMVVKQSRGAPVIVHSGMESDEMAALARNAGAAAYVAKTGAFAELERTLAEVITMVDDSTPPPRRSGARGALDDARMTIRGPGGFQITLQGALLAGMIAIGAGGREAWSTVTELAGSVHELRASVADIRTQLAALREDVTALGLAPTPAAPRTVTDPADDRRRACLAVCARPGRRSACLECASSAD